MLLPRVVRWSLVALVAEAAAEVVLLLLAGASWATPLTATLTTLKGSWKLMRQLAAQQQQQMLGAM